MQALLAAGIASALSVGLTSNAPGPAGRALPHALVELRVTVRDPDGLVPRAQLQLDGVLQDTTRTRGYAGLLECAEDAPGELVFRLSEADPRGVALEDEARFELWARTLESRPGATRMGRLEWTGSLAAGVLELPPLELVEVPLLVSGTLSGPEGPVAGVRLLLFDPDASPLERMAWDTSGVDGAFEIRGPTRKAVVQVMVDPRESFRQIQAREERIAFPNVTVPSGTTDVPVRGGAPVLDVRVGTLLPPGSRTLVVARDVADRRRSFPLYHAMESFSCGFGANPELAPGDPLRGAHVHGELPPGRYDFFATTLTGELRAQLLDQEVSLERSREQRGSLLEPGRTEPTPYALRHVPLGSMRPVESAPR